MRVTEKETVDAGKALREFGLGRTALALENIGSAYMTTMHGVAGNERAPREDRERYVINNLKAFASKLVKAIQLMDDEPRQLILYELGKAGYRPSNDLQAGLGERVAKRYETEVKP